jgi:hypothetical protein
MLNGAEVALVTDKEQAAQDHQRDARGDQDAAECMDL